MKIAVIDGQGGGIGKVIVSALRKELPENTTIYGLGTNSQAATVMMKSGASECASGENAIAVTCKNVDVIVGTVGIVIANSMLGELTPKMAVAIAESPAKKILIPLNKCNVEIVGTSGEPLPHYVDRIVQSIKMLPL